MNLQEALKLLSDTLKTGVNYTVEYDSSNGFEPKYVLKIIRKNKSFATDAYGNNGHDWHTIEVTSEEDVINTANHIVNDPDNYFKKAA